MDAIVLVKYVADIENVPPDAWDLSTGTLRRGRLKMIANPLDDHALQFAKAFSPGTIIALSMGPASAQRICRRAIAYGADRAVLLCDRAFAGSDTLATARTLSRAVARIIEEYDLDRPLVVAGMQSPDGDTAQVPAEVAAVLDVPIVPYVTAYDGETFTVMERDGHSVLRLARRPAVVTVTGHAPELPFYTSLERFSRASSAAIEVWDAQRLGLDPQVSGLKGSATRVVEIENVARRGGPHVSLDVAESDSPDADIEGFIARIVHEVRGADAAPEPACGPRSGMVPESGAADVIDRRPMSEAGPGLTLVETQDGRPTKAGLELLGETRRLADRDARHAGALILGGLEREVDLSRYGATTAFHVTCGERVADHHLAAWMLSRAIETTKPEFVLIPASLRGRTIASLAAARLGLGLTADCTALDLADEHPGGPDAEPRDGPPDPMARRSRLRQTRPALGGNVLATIVSTTAPAMATVRAGVFAIRAYPTAAIPVEHLDFRSGPDSGVEYVERERASADTDGADDSADIVVAVGNGIGTRARVDSYVLPLIDALRRFFGTSVTLACSRAAVEAGILPYPYQIGQTGKTVRPSLYVALGISGAIQHRLGMERSAVVVSVNPDPHAAIHQISRLSMIGTIDECVPAMTRALAMLPSRTDQ